MIVHLIPNIGGETAQYNGKVGGETARRLFNVLHAVQELLKERAPKTKKGLPLADCGFSLSLAACEKVLQVRSLLFCECEVSLPVARGIN